MRLWSWGLLLEGPATKMQRTAMSYGLGSDANEMPNVDALHLSIALGPLAVYFLLLGFVNLSTRPFVTTGARDVGALGLAVAGLIMAGPMELFLPEAATHRFGGYVWLLLLAFYGLCLTLLVLLLRPRLVIYNVNPDQLRAVLAEVVTELDAEARWAGDSLALPKLGVQLHIDLLGAMRNVQLVAAGPRQSFAGWKRLEMALAKVLHQTAASPNPHGFGLLALGVLLIC
ncbi:MAG: hypothetical protein ACYC6N_28545, partial [Pirellulaceae bacterium]